MKCLVRVHVFRLQFMWLLWLLQRVIKFWLILHLEDTFRANSTIDDPRVFTRQCFFYFETCTSSYTCNNRGFLTENFNTQNTSFYTFAACIGWWLLLSMCAGLNSSLRFLCLLSPVRIRVLKLLGSKISFIRARLIEDRQVFADNGAPTFLNAGW